MRRSPPLLLMNNSDGNVVGFVTAYTVNREIGFSADEAVEFALAGLSGRREIAAVRKRATDLGLPVSITAALLRSSDDGVAVFQEVLGELPIEGATSDARRTIAAILAVSLEPAQAVRRWVEAREMLAGLGMQGSYATSPLRLVHPTRGVLASSLSRTPPPARPWPIRRSMTPTGSHLSWPMKAHVTRRIRGPVAGSIRAWDHSIRSRCCITAG